MSGFSNAQNNPAGATPMYLGRSYANSALNITVATVVKAAPGTALVATVVVAGAGAGSINDCITTGAADATNTIASLPTTVGPIALNFPCQLGIVVKPGAGQTIAISYA